jgi:hypothetical protein
MELYIDTAGVGEGGVMDDLARYEIANTALKGYAKKCEELIAVHKAEVERLQGCNTTNISEQARLINERDAAKEALRRVVGACQNALMRRPDTDEWTFIEAHANDVAEALAFARGVSTPAVGERETPEDRENSVHQGERPDHDDDA